MENKHKQFNAFDKVLVRIVTGWECDFYSHYIENNGYPHKTLGWRVKDENILPYKGNEHLVGTTDEPEEIIYLKAEYIIAFNSLDSINKGIGVLLKYSGILGDGFIVSGETFSYPYCIRLSDFDTDNMEETRKNILCIRNGNIVRYKE